MKIKISFTEDERQQAEEAAELLRFTMRVVKMKESDRYKPFHHLYLATKNRAKPLNKL